MRQTPRGDGQHARVGPWAGRRRTRPGIRSVSSSTLRRFELVLGRIFGRPKKMPLSHNTGGLVQAMIELDGRFKDGRLSFAAKDQIAEYHTVKGGWAEEYKNVLEPDAWEQQKSVVAIKSSSFGLFKNSFPYTNDVVQEVQAAICKLVPSYTGKLDSSCHTSTPSSLAPPRPLAPSGTLTRPSTRALF